MQPAYQISAIVTKYPRQAANKEQRFILSLISVHCWLACGRQASDEAHVHHGGGGRDVEQSKGRTREGTGGPMLSMT